jgi:hypothetical protein
MWMAGYLIMVTNTSTNIPTYPYRLVTSLAARAKARGVELFATCMRPIAGPTELDSRDSVNYHKNPNVLDTARNKLFGLHNFAICQKVN